MNIGDRVKEIRKLNDLTQQQFANSLSIGREHLAKIETNRELPSLSLLINLCEIYKLSLSEFFNFNSQLQYTKELQLLINEAKNLNNDELALITALLKKLKNKQ